MKSIVFIVFVVFVVEQGAQGCNPSASPQLVWNANKGYHFGTYTKMNWFKANEHCRSIGMQLATISNADQGKFLANYILAGPYTSTNYWTSGNILSNPTVWTWMSTGVPMSKSLGLWASGEPNNANNVEKCINLQASKSFLFNDEDCNGEFYFICETIDC